VKRGEIDGPAEQFVHEAAPAGLYFPGAQSPTHASEDAVWMEEKRPGHSSRGANERVRVIVIKCMRVSDVLMPMCMYAGVGERLLRAKHANVTVPAGHASQKEMPSRLYSVSMEKLPTPQLV
jgi:hypothetical protein